jgi:hypothetical protein
MVSAEQLAEYNAKAEAAFANAKRLLEDPSWSKNKEDSGMILYTRYEAGSSFAQVKSVVTVNKPAQVVFDYIKSNRPVDPSTPKDKNEGCLARRAFDPVEGDPNEAQFYYICVLSGKMMVWDRDFLMFQRTFTEGDTKYLVRTSIVNKDLMDDQPKAVRATMHFQVFIVVPDGDKATLTFMCHADPAGSIPAAVYNLAVANQGYSALRSKQALEA